jgi:SAM-dependent methyltransferase
VIRILRARAEIEDARRELARRGLSFEPSLARRAIEKAGAAVGIPRGQRPDPLKSWDVLRTIETVEAHVARERPVLDAGCYCSQTLWILRALGYRDLHGCDLDPRVIEGPFADEIHYSVQDMTRTSYPDAKFAAIVTISTIEHGVDPAAFLAESARLLAPGGLLIFSTDYAPAKVDTTGKTAFGLEWRIWSESELRDLVEQATRSGFAPLGDARFDDSDLPIDWNDRRYTFAWGALRRSA